MSKLVDPPLNLDRLLALRAAGERFRYLYFWGHRRQRHDNVGAGCLSQWYPARFTVDGRAFATAEHYMMFGKAMLFGDRDVAERVLAAATPGQAKALGRKVRGFCQSIWDGERFALVVAGNLAKFGQDPASAEYLLATGKRVLVEASPVDRVWGIGLAATDPRAADPQRWRGLNLLGFALMAVRSKLAGLVAGG